AGKVLGRINTYQKFSNPFVMTDDGTMYAGVGKSTLLAVNAAGVIRWKRRFDTSIGRHILPGPGGEIYLLSDHGVLYSLSARGTERFRVSTGLKSILPIGMDGQGRILIAADDGFLHLLLPWGEEVWKFRLAGPALAYAFYGSGILCTTAAGTLVYVDGDGKMVWQYAADERLSELVHDGTHIYAAGEEGLVLALGTDGRLLWHERVESSASALYLGNDRSLVLTAKDGGIFFFGSDGRLYGTVTTGTGLEAGLLASSGILVVGGSDWIVSGFSAPRPHPEWAQAGGNTGRTWSAMEHAAWRYWLSFFEKDPDYLAVNAMIVHGLSARDPDALTCALDALEETVSGDEKFLREPYLLFFLERIITHHILEPTRTVPAKDYPGIRIRALGLLEQMDSSYRNEIYLTLCEHEWDTSVLAKALKGFEKLPVDENGRLSKAISARLLRQESAYDIFTSAAIDALLAAARYRGSRPDTLITDAAMFVYRNTRDEAIKRKALLLMRY
ncbi:MAG: PQQ-like beta-propeller repeat protein, partial [Spirochaetales bacterium]|nr:PQQ-like beta-propeller repeat protein [Spirochaetales bacterium]